MNKKIFILLSFMYFSLSVNCQPVSTNDIFSDKDISRITSGEIITRMYIKNNAVGENTDIKINVPKTSYCKEDFSNYEMITDEKAFIPYDLNDNSRIKFYNTLTAFSKLKGMQYYSKRIRKVETLILDCYQIESINKKNKIKDITYTSISSAVTNYFIQKDNRFGTLTFKSELYNEGDNFIFINTCQDKLSVLVFNAAGKEEYKFITYFIYNKEKKGFFYYTVNMMRIRNDVFLNSGSKLTLFPTFFSNRLRAGTVHFVKLLGLNWDDKINPWDRKKLKQGFYKNY
jgi:hypothetical protein